MLSKSQVNTAGDVIRALRGGEAVPFHSYEKAISTIDEYRTSHVHALQTAAVGLRYYVGKHSKVLVPIRVGQRLKRLPTIMDKLCREPHMKLARMHDIAGCRAIVANEKEVRAIAKDLVRQRRWNVRREYDYMERPKPVSGYRAHHLVVQKEGYLVEIQLRTLSQHAWAELIEHVDRQLPDVDLKSGRAPADLLEYYRLGALLLAGQERREPPNADILSKFRELHVKVNSYISENSTQNGS